MASYVAPLPEEIENWTGVNILATGIEAIELELLLNGLQVQAESKAALAITTARFISGDLDAYQVGGLTRAVALIMAAYWLRSPQVRKTTGTFEPLLVESSRDIGEVIQSLLDEAAELLADIAGGGGSQDNKYQWADRGVLPTFTRTTVW